MIAPGPDAQLVRFSRDHVVPSWARVFLELQDRAHHADERIVVQFEQFFTGGALKLKARHDHSESASSVLQSRRANPPRVRHAAPRTIGHPDLTPKTLQAPCAHLLRGAD